MSHKTDLIDEDFAKEAIKNWLSQNGWNRRIHIAGLRQRGVDIQVVNDKAERYLFVEVKGESDKSSVNYNNVIFALGQIVLRMKTIARHAYIYGVGYPKPLADKAVRKIPYQFAKLVNLWIFSVDKKGEVKKYTWIDLRNIQH